MKKLELNYLINCCKFATKYLIILVFPMILVTFSCSKPDQEKEQIFKKKRINPSAEEKAKEFRDKGGGIFNSSRNQGSTTFEFS